ncbi:GNAT family N-acetyltransferase [Hyalangium rubrum]|uniref:GNAT family protein n=1 Tax=Hyalangium rubrum TaxID=3103134 RepID=A0ABU5HI50_9BACT|nr:GNAT family protein [Hyalangium sp. s54d21]MDY7233135.1 GNAT family protein [Hyalangium sp. s54d21]
MLKSVVREDSQLLADWLGDPDFAGSFLNVWPVSREQWEGMLSHPWDARTDGMFLILASEGGEPMGLVGYFNPFTRTDLFQGLEIWAQVHPRFRQRRIAVTACRLLISRLFSTLPVERIQATVTVGNDAPCHVAHLLGMQREGICRSITLLNGRYADMYLYSILRSDWRSEAEYLQAR